MDKLYLWINLVSITVPVLFTFHPRLKFYRKWGGLLLGVAFMMLIFVTWDVYFTHHGIWGFNQDYLIGVSIYGLPIEEWLFFICIPYASLFLNHVLSVTHPNFTLSDQSLNWIFTPLIIVSLILTLTNMDKWYTAINFMYASIVLIVGVFWFRQEMQRFSTSFLIILFPFLMVNGILTGTGLDNPIVWYNNNHNLGIRVASIPIEDIMYAFTMLITPLFVMKLIKTNQG